MPLTPPKQMTFLISVVLALIASTGSRIWFIWVRRCPYLSHGGFSAPASRLSGAPRRKRI